MEESRTKDLVEEVDQEEKNNEKEVEQEEEQEEEQDDGDDDDDDNDNDVDDDNNDDDEEVISILCEIVGARNLVCREVGSDTNNNNNNDNNHENATTTATWDWMQPFCVVKLGDTIIHRTHVAFDPGCHPIWTISTNSLFVLKITLREVLSVLEKNTHKNKNNNNNDNKTGTNGVLSFAVYTQNKQDMVSSLSVSRFLGASEQTIFLGKVDLDVSKILFQHCNEQRLEVDLLAATAAAAAATAEEQQQVGNYHHHHHHQTHKNRETLCVGSLAVRFRLVTLSDQRIMERFHANSKPGALESITNTTSHEEEKTKRPLAKLITETDETEVAQSTFVNAISNVFFTTDSNNTNNNNTGQDGEKEVRVKPSPDPNRVDETTFLTPQRIRVETHLPSHQWVEAGSGSLGKLYVEILSCHDLPNVDLGEAVVRFYLCIYQSIKQSIHVLCTKKATHCQHSVFFPFFFVIRAI